MMENHKDCYRKTGGALYGSILPRDFYIKQIIDF